MIKTSLAATARVLEIYTQQDSQITMTSPDPFFASREDPDPSLACFVPGAHRHLWPEHGFLRIYDCEVTCQYCQSRNMERFPPLFRSVVALRTHVLDHLFPDSDHPGVILVSPRYEPVFHEETPLEASSWLGPSEEDLSGQNSAENLLGESFLQSLERFVESGPIYGEDLVSTARPAMLDSQSSSDNRSSFPCQPTRPPPTRNDTMPPPYPLPAWTAAALITRAASALQLHPSAHRAFFILAWHHIRDTPGVNIVGLQRETHPNARPIPRALVAIVGEFLQKWGPYLWPDGERLHLQQGQHAHGGFFYSRDTLPIWQCILDWHFAFPLDPIGIPPVAEQYAFTPLGMYLVEYFKCILHYSLNNDDHMLTEYYPDERTLWLEIMNSRAG